MASDGKGGAAVNSKGGDGMSSLDGDVGSEDGDNGGDTERGKLRVGDASS